MDNNEIALAAQEHNLVAREVDQMVVQGQEGLNKAGEALLDVKKELRKYQDRLEQITAPLKEALKSAQDLFKPVIHPLEMAERILKEKISKATQEIAFENMRALQAAQQAMIAGDVKGAAMAASSVSNTTQVEGVRTQEILNYRVVDARIIPREFLVVDDKAVKAFIKKHKGEVQIPGIVIEKSFSVIAKRG
jgi:division protein CdvB (Snf7/Vps24/ESCRT-III family)